MIDSDIGMLSFDTIPQSYETSGSRWRLLSARNGMLYSSDLISLLKGFGVGAPSSEIPAYSRPLSCLDAQQNLPVGCTSFFFAVY